MVCYVIRAMPDNDLYIIMQIWYWIRFGNGSHFNSLNINLDGVIMSTLRMIRAERFWSFRSLLILSRTASPNHSPKRIYEL